MKHTYNITGMVSDISRNQVENALNKIEGISAEVTLNPAEAVITMDEHVPTGKLQEALARVGDYNIEMTAHQNSAPVMHDHKHTHEGHQHHGHHHHHHTGVTAASGHKHQGDVYYCPMHCEDEKTYDEPGNCPVCGMDLIKQPSLKQAAVFTCPMPRKLLKMKQAPAQYAAWIWYRLGRMRWKKRTKPMINYWLSLK